LGKPYWTELELLPETFAWALEVDIREVSRAIAATQGSELVCIGSGGSFSAAAFVAWLHQELTGRLAVSATPWQASRMQAIRNCAAVILSAGGKNPDVLGVFKALLKLEPRSLGILCLAKDTPLGELCRRYQFVSCAEFAPPSGKDGFVATNSLLALSTLVWRAYSELAGAPIQKGVSLENVLQADVGLQKWSANLAVSCEHLWKRPHLMVLHGGGSTVAGVMDLESKFSEAAIGAIQLADYRNFAHGRHHWLAKKGDETGILAFVAAEDEEIAEKTLRLIPKNIAIARIPIKNAGTTAGIETIVKALYIAGYAASARGIDAGRPGVPGFGRRIYHLNGWSSKGDSSVPEQERVAIVRKTSRPLEALSTTELRHWREEYKRFVAAITKVDFQGLVLDYDGTLCDECHRFGSLPDTVKVPLNSLLRNGVLLGIATGRGKSVRKSLRDAIDSQFWSRVVIAYHNGSETGTLDDDGVPPEKEEIGPALREIAKRIKASRAIGALADCECKKNQISVVARNPANAKRIHEMVCDLACSEFEAGISCVRSSHSVDVLAPGINKLSLLKRLGEVLGMESPNFLCIGDLGSWPGNDFLLLSTPYSLSADQTSSVPDRCWNLAPAGYRNSQATEFFLNLARVSKGRLRLEHVRWATPIRGLGQ
jgi:hypothetical protein